MYLLKFLTALYISSKCSGIIIILRDARET